jgi:hypothetical protein
MKDENRRLETDPSRLPLGHLQYTLKARQIEKECNLPYILMQAAPRIFESPCVHAALKGSQLTIAKAAWILFLQIEK